MDAKRRRRVLVLCTGNSARSQMAEGLINSRLDDAWEASSAGTEPSGRVQPLAIKAMAEVGIDISGQRSKSTDGFRGAEFDLVVTVCDHAAETCPVWLGRGRRVHIGFEDPAAAKGSEAEQAEVYRSVRDQIAERVLGHLREFDDRARAPLFFSADEGDTDAGRDANSGSKG
jgi:arsenate reductase (thioredoxin)